MTRDKRNISRIHKCTISLSFLSKILRVLRLAVSVYILYIKDQFQATFAQGGGGVKSVSTVEVTVNRKEENT